MGTQPFLEMPSLRVDCRDKIDSAMYWNDYSQDHIVYPAMCNHNPGYTSETTHVAPQFAKHPEGGNHVLQKDSSCGEPVTLFSFDYGRPPNNLQNKKTYSSLDTYSSKMPYITNISPGTSLKPPRNMPISVFES